MIPIPVIEENKPFKNREDIMSEIRNCDFFGGICQFACFGFTALGVISDAFNITLVLEPMSWFLLAIIAGLNAIIGHMHVVVAKHFLGIDVERNQQ